MFHPGAGPATMFPPDAIAGLEGLARTVDYGPGEVILRDGEPVPSLALVERGRVALRLRVPARGSVTIVTIEPGEIVGWSALVPPYRATAEAVAVEPTRLVAYDAAALRDRLDVDPVLAGRLLPVLLAAVSERLTASWQQLLDLFGEQVFEPW